MRIVSRTRAELEDELADIWNGCLGSDELRWAALDALIEIEMEPALGSVQVGHTIFVIDQEAQASQRTS